VEKYRYFRFVEERSSTTIKRLDIETGRVDQLITYIKGHFWSPSLYSEEDLSKTQDFEEIKREEVVLLV